MKRRLLGIVLALMLIIAVLPITATPTAQATPSEAALSAAYAAYYDVLMAAMDDIAEAEAYGDDDPGELKYAYLIELDENEIPMLVYNVYYDYPSPVTYLYGFVDGEALLFLTESTAGDPGYAAHFGFYEDTGGQRYIVRYLWELNESEKPSDFYDYFILNNGLLRVKLGLSRNVDMDIFWDTYEVVSNKWFVNGEPVSEQEYIEAPMKYIGTLEKLEVDFLTIDEILTLLQSLQSTAPLLPAVVFANPTKSTVYINDVATVFDAYLIDDENYFKLRDMAFALSGTEKQFNAEFINGEAVLTSNQPYTVVGQEMIPGDGLPKSATLNTTMNFIKDGEKVAVRAYLIGDNNYFRVRDILRLFDIGWDYDGDIYIITSEGYHE